MAHASLVRSGCASLAISLLAAACGGGGDDAEGRKVYTPPASATPGGTASPQATATAPDPGAVDGIGGARAALQAFLRGQAAGDAAVCRYVAVNEAFVNGPALKGDCTRGVENTPHVLRPQERQAMRTVVVTGGRLRDGDAVIPFTALHWTSGNMTVNTLQDTFILRRTKLAWQIVG
ncbi:hypothetical protein AGRA3207_006280 [Actinomadura graeca]|uniref:Nuclear transport factor 2 family protein n=1 Tax=Actinomadura graeca TaxID=2750812 RepID=A0ABX8R1B4_9ACTN|nr:hypothetical protein [Actinomadura graeca]QXJ24871.1 hypothetical protein AGRA3207_006280 [Actinomadura graeca]